MNLWTPEEKLNYVYAFMRYGDKDVELDFWQDDFIMNRSRYICILKSRQTGFSFAVSVKGLVKAMDPARSNYTKQFVSYNMEDAQEKIRYAVQFYDSIPNRHKKRLVHQTATMLEFEDVGTRTTSRLISLPCRPPRGKNGDVCLDEFAIYLPRLSKQIYTAASFCTLRRGCIEVGSTPLGTIGQFYEICTDRARYKSFDRYSVPWWYANVMCRDVREAVRSAKDMTTEERVERFGTGRLISLFNNSTLEDFQQECECTFVDSSESYISLELILANTPGRRERDSVPDGPDVSDADYAAADCEIKPFKDADSLMAGYRPEKHGKPLFLGYDVAKNRDATAIYVLGIVDGKKRAVMRFERTSVPFEEQKEIVRRLMRELPVYRACMDCTGMGAPICEELRKEFGDRIEGINFTLQSKERLAMGVKFGLERGGFELENDKNFHAQIHSIKRMPSAGGSFRYDAERNERGHADSFWAWALASFAADGERPGFYEQWRDSHGKDGGKERKRGKSLRSVLRRVARQP